MVTRRGHSLVEMVVALTFLGASLAAIAAAGVVSTRRTRDAVRIQEGIALAAAVLDSLVAATGGAGPGEQPTAWGLLAWDVRSIGSGTGVVTVQLRDAGGDTVTLLRGARIGRAPTLPPPGLPVALP